MILGQRGRGGDRVKDRDRDRVGQGKAGGGCESCDDDEIHETHERERVPSTVSEDGFWLWE